ncbi:DKNYY domain-containing protein [uncultured Tenacibaculum sp.]|uniref:DKNYY domain-containing protein n=1 Tax=uncultured Tenacibaculum sp. TaxID=174713 RepID=UPI0026315E76|nr:DKNYY domain-containing protein [uncultured Tenacibaculum sp.]
MFDPKKSKSYFIKNNNIYYSPNGNWFELGYNKSEADAKTFEILSEKISKDSKSIYLGYTKQNQIDYSSFKLDSNGIPKDKNNVYEYGINHLEPVEINGIDVETFEYLRKNKSSQYSWTKDKNNYYFKGKKLNVNYKTLKFLNDDFFYDNEHLYSDLKGWKIITISKTENYPKKINEKYILSNNTLYYVGENEERRTSLFSEKIEKYEKFISISKNVVLIDSIIFSFGTKYEPLNPKTFEKIKIDYNSFETIYESHSKISFNYYKDIRNIYFNNFIIKKANPKTFEVLDLGFSKDDKYVFYNTEILKGVDSKSFRKNKIGLTWKDDFGNEFDYKGNRIN